MVSIWLLSITVLLLWLLWWVPLSFLCWWWGEVRFMIHQMEKNNKQTNKLRKQALLCLIKKSAPPTSRYHLGDRISASSASSGSVKSLERDHHDTPWQKHVQPWIILSQPHLAIPSTTHNPNSSETSRKSPRLLDLLLNLHLPPYPPIPNYLKFYPSCSHIPYPSSYP